MQLTLYHATTSKAARSIEQTQFRAGKRGYAGAAIYFSADPEKAIRHCFNGVAFKAADASKAAEVVICCSVNLGRCLTAEKKTVDKESCLSRGYDSVNIQGTDTYAVYDPSQISVKEYRRIADNVCWQSSSSDDNHDSASPLEIMMRAIQVSATGTLSAASDMSKLYEKHPSLRKAIRAAGGLKAFCKIHDELSMDGQAISIAKTQHTTAGTGEGSRMHGTVRRQAEEQRLQTEARVKQEERQQRKAAEKNKADLEARQRMHQGLMQMQHERITQQRLRQQQEILQAQEHMRLKQDQAASQTKQWQARQEEFHRQMQQARQERQALHEGRNYPCPHERQVQSAQVSAWQAFQAIIFGGIAAGLRCLLGVA